VNEERYYRPITSEDISKYGGWIVLGLFIIVLLFTSVYMVDTDARGVVLRFGKFVRMTEPGLHVKLPFWIERVETPRVERVFKEEFGFRTLKPGVETLYSPYKSTDVSLMLCGDLNVAEVEWIVQFKISEPEKWLFKIRNLEYPHQIIRDVSEAVMRTVVGDSSVDEVLTTRRIEINIEAQQKMQEIMDEYDAGIKIVTVKLQDVNPPEEVKPAFNEVNAAQQDREKFVNQAWEEYNKVIPRARGEAKQMVEQAEAYAINRVNVAEGDAKKFEQVLAEYQKAEEVTRRRLYLEALANVLPNIEKKYVVDEKVKGLLPLLRLGEE
jgi:membrane protease subunit HflK